MTIDTELLDFFINQRAEWLTPPVVLLTQIGRPYLVLLYAVLGVLIPITRGHRRWVLLPVMVLAANLANHLIKAIIDRPRPALDMQLLYYYTPSMPSGHAMGIAALATGLVLLAGWRWWTVLACGVALAVGWTRLYLGVHWPSDVLVGWLAGALVAWGVYRLARIKFT